MQARRPSNPRLASSLFNGRSPGCSILECIGGRFTRRFAVVSSEFGVTCTLSPTSRGDPYCIPRVATFMLTIKRAAYRGRYVLVLAPLRSLSSATLATAPPSVLSRRRCKFLCVRESASCKDVSAWHQCVVVFYLGRQYSSIYRRVVASCPPHKPAATRRTDSELTFPSVHTPSLPYSLIAAKTNFHHGARRPTLHQPSWVR